MSIGSSSDLSSSSPKYHSNPVPSQWGDLSLTIPCNNILKDAVFRAVREGDYPWAKKIAVAIESDAVRKCMLQYIKSQETGDTEALFRSPASSVQPSPMPTPFKELQEKDRDSVIGSSPPMHLQFTEDEEVEEGPNPSASPAQVSIVVSSVADKVEQVAASADVAKPFTSFETTKGKAQKDLEPPADDTCCNVSCSIQ
jgi:hypothetical protein